MRSTGRAGISARLAAMAAGVALVLMSGVGASGADETVQRGGRAFHNGGIVNRQSGKGLDIEGASGGNQANVQQWEFRGAPNQMWTVTDRGNGRHSIVSQRSGLALDVVGASTADGANVQQFRFSDGPNQLWRFESVRGGFFQIVNVASGKCLDVEAGRINENGANVQQWSCSGQPNQQWRLVTR